MSGQRPRTRPYRGRAHKRARHIPAPRHRQSSTADTLVLTALIDSDWRQTWTA